MNARKTRVTPEQAMEMIKAAIGQLPHGYKLAQSSGWIRIHKGDGSTWDRPGMEFRLDIADRKVYARYNTTPPMRIRIQIDLPTFLEANVVTTGLIRDLQFYSDLWTRVGQMGETLEIVLDP